ncbi:MAG: hypothetical protein ACREAA_07765 [Candidatus Polarisedimenticolia bacterium]
MMIAFSVTLALGAGTAGAASCTAEQGQLFINQGRYDHAIREFTCVIDSQPTGVEGYRGRIEAELLSGRYSDAVRDNGRVVAFVEPVNPDAEAIIMAGYDARLASNPKDIAALTGASFSRWYDFDYPTAIQLANRLVGVSPHDLYGNLFRGSGRVLKGASRAAGLADLEAALALAPDSPDVRFIVADAYTYGKEPDPHRAFEEASRALAWGLDTPRVHAILASAYKSFGDTLASAAHVQEHLEIVTTELVTTLPLAGGASVTLPLVAGRTFEIPLAVAAGKTLSIVTGSPDFYDTILLLLGPDGSPVLSSDDDRAFFAAFTWVAGAAGDYRLLVTSFEAINNGQLMVTRSDGR